jgi:hypothetical protein
VHDFIEYFFSTINADVDGEPFNIVVVAEISSRDAVLGHGGFYISLKILKSLIVRMVN